MARAGATLQEVRGGGARTGEWAEDRCESESEGESKSKSVGACALSQTSEPLSSTATSTQDREVFLINSVAGQRDFYRNREENRKSLLCRGMRAEVDSQG